MATCYYSPVSTYHHGQLRQALIDAALELEPEYGPLGFSLREVSRRAGVTHTAVYHHFASKEALVIGVAEYGYDGLLSALREPAVWAGGKEPFLNVMEMPQRYVRFALASPSQFRFMFGVPSLAASALAERQDAVLDEFARVVAEAQEAGLMRDGVARRYAAQLWSLTHGAAALSISDALDGIPRGRHDKQSAAARTRRARDMVGGAVAGWVMGVVKPGSKWSELLVNEVGE